MDKLYITELDIWGAFLEGNKRAYQQLYEKYFNGLYEYGFRFCADPELIKDAIHDLFVGLWQKREILLPVNSVKAYLLTSLRNQILNKLDRLKHYSLAGDEEEYRFEISFSYEKILIQLESDQLLSQRITDALNKLSIRQKEAIYLRFYEGLAYPELAEVMGITVKAAYKIVARALDSIKQQFGNVNPAVLLILLFNASYLKNFF